MRTNKTLFCLLLLSLFSGLPAARAQVKEAAVGADRHLWVGAEYSNFDPDYNFYRVDGIGFYGDYSITRNFSGEAEIRLLDLNKPGGLTEKTFLAGPTYTFYRYHRASAYAKGLLGLATFNYPYNIGYGSYFAYELSGGVEYRLKPRWKLRGEYDRETLPSAPGFPNQPSNGLTPIGFSAGISYRIF